MDFSIPEKALKLLYSVRFQLSELQLKFLDFSDLEPIATLTLATFLESAV